ncbi:hypothetical protein C0J52_09409 [Blattella germanica]|nr:hypothetical protein C0J52_09409 [Blattella germanica]
MNNQAPNRTSSNSLDSIRYYSVKYKVNVFLLFVDIWFIDSSNLTIILINYRIIFEVPSIRTNFQILLQMKTNKFHDKQLHCHNNNAEFSQLIGLFIWVYFNSLINKREITHL